MQGLIEWTEAKLAELDIEGGSPDSSDQEAEPDQARGVAIRRRMQQSRIKEIPFGGAPASLRAAASDFARSRMEALDPVYIPDPNDLIPDEEFELVWADEIIDLPSTSPGVEDVNRRHFMENCLLILEGLAHPENPERRQFARIPNPPMEYLAPELLKATGHLLRQDPFAHSLPNLFHAVGRELGALPSRKHFMEALLNQRQYPLKPLTPGGPLHVFPPAHLQKRVYKALAKVRRENRTLHWLDAVPQSSSPYVQPLLRRQMAGLPGRPLLPMGPDRVGLRHHLAEIVPEADWMPIQAEATRILSQQPEKQMPLEDLLNQLPTPMVSRLKQSAYLLDAVLLADYGFIPGRSKSLIGLAETTPLLPQAEEADFPFEPEQGRDILRDLLNGKRISSELSKEERRAALRELNRLSEELQATALIREASRTSKADQVLPNPYRDGTLVAEIFDHLLSSPSTFDEVKALFGDTAKTRSAFYMVTSPRRSRKKGDLRGHPSAKGHLYFAEKSPGQNGKWHLLPRNPPLPPRQRG